jgi:hypothetical protein
MPVFGNDSYAEGIVQVGATGATGAVAYQANNGDIVLATGGASGSGGVVVTLPNIVTLFPAVAVQPPVGPLTAHDIIAVNGATGASGASGSLYGEVISGYLGDTNPPVSPDADSLCVQVKLVAQGAAGVGVEVVSADGSLVGGVAGATGVSTTTLQAGWKFVSVNGNWVTV